MKKQTSSSSLKKAVAVQTDGAVMRGYVNPSGLGREEIFSLLTQEGERREIPLQQIRCVYFVREFTPSYEPSRKEFLSRPKLDGLWVRLKFHDNDVMEGVVPNDLLAILDSGVHITPPDLHGDTLRMFIPRSALAEMKVLGVVGIARRKPAVAPAAAQPVLFPE
ncbi:MAG: hypothetical protein WAM91_09480 [Candidatus Acidiferrales bacterium]